tara:strand:- start:1751 stop:1975 length:225 start_codon:yes stop_codon:yes gene_type:complete
MNCWHCNTKLIWGGDHDGDQCMEEDIDLVTNLSCPNCETFVYVYHRFKPIDDKYKKKTLNEGDFYDDFNYVYYC